VTDVAELRGHYEAGRDDVSRAERDRSQLLAALSSVTAATDAVLRGTAEDVPPAALVDLAAVPTDWSYDRVELESTVAVDGQPGFQAFEVDTVDALHITLLDQSHRQHDESFADLADCIEDAVSGGGQAYQSLSDRVYDLRLGYDQHDDDLFEAAAEALVTGFRDRGVETGADLRTLLAAERGARPGSDVLALQNDQSIRTAATDAFRSAIAAGDADAAAAAREPFADAVAELEAFASEREGDLGSTVEQLTDAYPEDLTDAHPALDHETPVLLTPTRLETRFVELDDPADDESPWQLLVRVYPDDLHVDTHEPALTDAEVEGGATFWRHVWWASHPDDRETLTDVVPDRTFEGVEVAGFPADPADRHEAVRERAWNVLAERFGPERAAWVKRAMAPADADDILAGPDERGTVSDGDYADFEDELDRRRQSVDRRPGAWTRPPRARLLPDQWIAFAETDGDEVTATSEPITPPLSIGPDPDPLQSAVETDDGPSDIRDGEMDWVFQYDAATQAGMALELELTEDQWDEGIDRLVVLGVSTGRGPDTAAEEVSDLFEAHRYTAGLSIIERGMPTNDTREDGAGTLPSGEDSIYERECTRSPVSPADSTADAAHVADLLGIGPDVGNGDGRFVLDRVRGADRSVAATAEAVNAALWSATLGYYIPHLVGPRHRTDDDADAGSPEPRNERLDLLTWLEGFRRHFVAYVRPGGPVPPLRVGSQPYGIVPTTARTDWQLIAGLYTTPDTEVPSGIGGEDYERLQMGERNVPDKLDELLTAARPIWRDAVADVPGVDAADDPELVVSELLEMAGTSYGYRLRDLLAADTIEELLGTPPDEIVADRPDSKEQLSKLSGESVQPRIGDLFAVDGEAAPVVDAPITGGDLGSTLRTFRTTRHDGLRTGIPGGEFDLDLGAFGSATSWLWATLLQGADQSLAEVLCYHALLQEYRLARVRLGHHYVDWGIRLERGIAWEESPWSLIPEASVYEAGDSTMWEFLEDPVSEVLAGDFRDLRIAIYDSLAGSQTSFDPNWTVGDLLRNVPPIDRPFAELVSAFETLEDADPAVLEQLIPETLDAASHRYDAWATSLSTRRLEAMRETGAEGLYVGAYGYLEDLEPRDEDADPRSKGYVHAPSLDQATAAAVLRSAHDAETDEYGDLFAVDLSADRVREARWLLEGVRAGFSLGELVGARFERALHEDYPDLELDKYVYPLRSIAPLVEGSIDRPEMDDADAVAERDIVDGERLYEHWQTEGLDWGQPAGSVGIELPAAGSDEAEAIEDELEAIGRAFDSLSDVLAAEGVYQLVRDNPDRAGAALDALSHGGPIDEVEVTETPRTGTSCTHRILTLLDDSATESAWVADASPRGLAEPALDDWLATILGDPAHVVCRVAYEPSAPEDPVCDPGTDDIEEDDGESEDEEDEDDWLPDWRVVPVYLSELELSALDVVSLVEGDEAAWGSELEARIEYHVRRTREDLDADGEIRLGFGPPEAWPDAADLGVDTDTAVGFGELLEVARTARSVVSNARPVDARDVTVPGEATDDGQVVEDLDDRAEAAVDTFEETLADLDAQAAVLAADRETDERVVEDLVALIDAVADLPDDGLADADDVVASVDGTTLHEELLDLLGALTGSDDLVATDEQGRVVFTPADDGNVVEGIATPGEDLQIRLTNNSGLFVQAEDTANEAGRFVVEFPTDELSHGDTFTITVFHEDASRTKYPGVFLEDADPELGVLDALRRFATVPDVLESVADHADPVLTAGEALDGDAIDAAIDRFDGAPWSTTAASDLADVRALLDAPVFTALSHWEPVATVAQVVAADELHPDAVTDALAGSVPTDGELQDLCLALSNDIRRLEDGIAAATRCPDLTFTEASLETVREGLLTCADYGIHGAVPLSATGASREDLSAVETLGRQARSVHEEATELLETAEAAYERASAEDDPDAYVACLEALFGEEFTVLVPFEPTNATELSKTLDSAHSKGLQAGDPLAVEQWFDRTVAVRDELDDFGRTLTYAETFGERSPADGARFRVGQLPFEAEDTWVGVPEAWTDEHPTGRLSLVSHGSGADAGEPYVGLFVDEFVETVPNDSETTGVSVHYDRPANQAPQSMLLAVPPTDQEEWSLATLADVVRESITLAKFRTVDRAELGEFGQILPGLAVASNESADPAGPDTASVDPDDLLADWKLTDGLGGGS
jgi:hypothetical protein